jgi:xanthine dehydrogenase molybdenum-binding subunit
MAKEFNVIGKSGLIDKQAEMIVTGKLDFAADNLPGKKLHARLLCSPNAHAKIKSIDYSKAMALKGVKAVVTYEDGYPFTEFLKQELTWWGQEVAVVVATEPDIAEEALSLIDVDYEVLPFVTDPDEAMKEGAPLVGCWPEGNVRSSESLRGDLEAGFDEADVIFEDTVGWTNYFQPCNIETRVTVAWWVGEHLYLRVPCANVATSRSLVAAWTGLPLNRVHLVSHGTGTVLGDKTTPKQTGVIAAMLSKRLGQPVQMEMTRREFFFCTQHQHKAKATIKIGAKNDGTITAIDATFYGDAAGLGSPWASDLSFPIKNTLRCPNGRFTHVDVATNTPWAYIYRSVQNPPGDFLMEVVLDEMAEELGMNPLDFRMKNLTRPEEVQQDNGMPFASNSVIECHEVAAKAIGWSEKWHEPGTKTLPDGRLHGMAIAGLVESHGSFGAPVGAILNMTRDGKVLCTHGITRVGAGTNSAIDAIVAEVLGLTYDDVMTGDWGNTDVAAEAGPQWGSQGTVLNGAAFMRAAEDLRDQLFERAAVTLEVSAADMAIGDGKVFVKDDPEKSLTIAQVAGARGTAPLIGRGYGWAKELQRPLNGFPAGTPCETRCQGAAAVEVAVDTETGEIEILNIVDVIDAGQVISLDGTTKQLYAGIEHIVAQAMFWEQIIDPTNGASVNPSLLEHRFPTTLDMNHDTYIPEIVESDDASGPYGLKGIGECIVAPFECIMGAVHNATGLWFKDAPIYPWKILAALGKA